MTTKTLIFSAFLGMAATVPAFGLEGRVAVKEGSAVSRSTTSAAPTPPLNAPQSPMVSLAEPYAILNTMSIFAVDHRSAERSGAPGRAQSSNPRPVSTKQYPVFRGVMIDDLGPVALMEVPDAKGGMSPAYLREGQTVPWGDSKVLSITLESMRLSRTTANSWQNSWIDIAIGNDLNGQQIGTLPLAPGTGNRNSPNRGGPRFNGMNGPRMGGNIDDSGVVNVGPDPTLPPSNVAGMESRMIQRRQNELREVSNPEAISRLAPAQE